jgi:hypothetical protein
MSLAQDIRPRPAASGWLWTAALAPAVGLWWLV